MDALEHRLHEDLTAAIRARDQVASATLRMALTAVKNEAVSGSEARELTDADVVVVLGREAKKFGPVDSPVIPVRDASDMLRRQFDAPARAQKTEFLRHRDIRERHMGRDAGSPRLYSWTCLLKYTLPPEPPL